MMSLWSLFLLVSLFCCVSSQSNPYPSNEYQYSFNRDLLMENERKYENRVWSLTRDEQTVDHYLQYLKWREFKATKNSGFPPSRPIEEQLSYIQTTEIYNALVKFPKGGIMHSHENHDVSKRILLDIVWESPDFQNLYMLPPNHTAKPWTLDFFINPPNDDPPWINVMDSNYTKEEILKQQTLLGILTDNATRYPTDSGLRWKAINPLWGRGSGQLIANINVKKKYLEAMYQVGWDQGVIYFETRKNLGYYERIYELDSSGNSSNTNGKRFLDERGDLDVQIAKEVSTNFSASHPQFVGHKRISYTSRKNSMDKFDAEMENVVRLHQQYPNDILGFDAVGEEDAGYAHLHFIEEFIKLYNSATQQPRVPIYLHTAETNWPDDLRASDFVDDLVATNMNTYETMLLNSKRIGHGYGYFKHPYLLNLIKERNIPMETCVVSNQLLGFSPDIRNHPALHNYRNGIKIMLSPDDAGTFGYDNFTVDWYEVYMAWGIGLGDLKTFALNSLNYSGMSESEKQDAIQNKWKSLYDTYIQNTSATACARDYAGEAERENRTITFARILPREGARSGITKVHVYGRSFEVGICKNISCMFGDRVSPNAMYVSNEHIICDAPDYGDNQVRTVSVSVSFNGSTPFLPTGFNFTYAHDPLVAPEPNTNPCPSGGNRIEQSNFMLSTAALVLLILICRIVMI